MDCNEELLQCPCWVMDILPERVPKNSPGQYFRVERYLMGEERSRILQQRIRVMLKLNCYREFTLEGEANPPPEVIADLLAKQYVLIRTGDALIASDPDDTYCTLYNPDEELLRLVRLIASGEGLYVWKGVD